MESGSKRARIAVALVTTLVAIPLIGRAVFTASHGSGADTYTNHKGMPIQWTTLLVFVGAFVVALLVAVVMRWWWNRPWGGNRERNR